MTSQLQYRKTWSGNMSILSEITDTNTLTQVTDILHLGVVTIMKSILHCITRISIVVDQKWNMDALKHKGVTVHGAQAR